MNILLNRMYKTRLHTIRTFLIFMLLLIAGSVTNEAWAAVTYHILTLPLSGSANTGYLHDWNVKSEYYGKRYEALRCTSESLIVGLPDDFKSPLLKDAAYHYYAADQIDELKNQSVYANNSTKLNIYSLKATPTELTKGDAIEDGSHIYVIYNYDRSNATYCTEKGQKLNLNGGVKYNIEISKDRFLAYNRDRGNRITAPKDNPVNETPGSEIYDRSMFFTKTKELMFKDEVVYLTASEITLTGTPCNLYFHFYLQGGDPYNIIIQTALTGYTYTQNNLKKNIDGAVLYGKVNANMWMQNEDRLTWTNRSSPISLEKPGWFKDNAETQKTEPVVSAFALLNHPHHESVSNWQSFEHDGGEYVFVASKMNYNGGDNQPDVKTGKYYYLHPNGGKDPQIQVEKNDNSILIKIGRTEHFVYKVKTPLTNTVLSAKLDMSTIFGDDDVLSCVPKTLLRKYATFTKAYADEAKTIEVSNFYEAWTNCKDDRYDGDDYAGYKVIWLEYETSMPFTTSLLSSPTYDDLKWCNFYVNKDKQYYAWYDDTQFATYSKHSQYSRDAHFAFVGDPFELKIVSRKVSDTNSGTPHYLALPSPYAEHGYLTTSATGTTWEIIYDNDNGNNSGCFRLKEFGAEHYIWWDYGNTGTKYALGTTANGESGVARITVQDLPKKTYFYYIMRGDKSIATMATVFQEPSTKLDFNHIPEIIRSPFLALPGVTLTFYGSEVNATAKANAETQMSPITYAPDYSSGGIQYIYVRYDMGSSLGSAPGSYITGGSPFNVRLNRQYLYYDETTIKTVADIGTNASEAAYQWILGGSDPYAMTIKNSGADKYVNVDFAPLIEACKAGDDEPDGEVSWSSDTPSKFIIKATSTPGLYEVMAALGEDIDSDINYFNFGRPTDANTIKLYGDQTFAHDYEQLYFQLTPLSAVSVTYHLIDKEGKDLLQVVGRQDDGTPPDFPDDYRSPLVTNYHYWELSNFTVDGDKYTLNSEQTEKTAVAANDNIYVTYDVTDKYDLQNKKTTYLLKFDAGTPFRAEDGTDDLETNPVTPIYPYCNGDCNFFVYGQAQFDLQQEGAASTRTRWAWYLESANNDPYHVKICSRQIETYNNDDIRGYFATYQPYGYDKVVTTLVWPTISGIQGTDYMILGSSTLFRLETSNEISLDSNFDGTPESTQRYTVKSFEQYWKTYDTVKNKLLKDILEAKDKGENPDGSILVPTVPADYRTLLTGTGSDQYGFHSYNKWAYAKRFNGYNKNGENKKGWEELEHWFQTVNMGEGYFTLVEIDINPVLILLDQHGWEIMRKPLPTSPDDETKAAKYEQIRLYDSPMVKAYYFWTKVSKRTGFHQYYDLTQQVEVDGKPFKSTSLTDLPPYDTATNLHDAKGNLYDQYVTYTVKDEYVTSYDASTQKGQPFLIQQGEKYASYDGSALSTPAVTSPGGMQQYIIDNIAKLTADGDKKSDLWYVKPNTRIDYEMGYVGNSKGDSGFNHDWTNSYTDCFSDGFDPYNIQISSVPHTKYFITNATGATLVEGAGSLVGVYKNDEGDQVDPAVAIGDPMTDIPCTWYDACPLAITNATFMAVQDANGNMQLMPRFDQNSRMKDFTDLVTPSDPNIDQTYTQLFRPLVYNYFIIDNDGHESLRYKSGGDLVPQTPDHFKSPLAKDFKYYKAATYSDGKYTIAESTDKTTSADEITESFASKGLTTAGTAGNNVYVRYSYDDEADNLDILGGKWLTMQLNNMDAIYNDGIKQGTDKPETIDADAAAKKWQWKFLETPQSTPDPYAVYLFNRNSPGTKMLGKRFALLSHTADKSYALAEAGTANEGYNTYNFLNGGGSMSTSEAATIVREAGFLSTSCTFSGTNSQIKLTDEVEHTFTYKIYTNGGVEAIQAPEDHHTDYLPVLPVAIKSPLLNEDQFRYYEQSLLGSVTEADTLKKSLTNLYGLYDDIVYVHYTPYDPLVTEYKVPNERVWPRVGTEVQRASTSNDASIDLNNELLYNIIWYDDHMMTCSDGDVITDGGSSDLMGDNAHEWQLDGNDPYAITIHSRLHDKYVKATGDACSLAAAGTPFMLLPSDGYDYGVLQVTGGTKMLSGYGNVLVSSAPTHFIPFLLSTHQVTYHLVIAKTCADQEHPNDGEYVDIPYRENKSSSLTTKRFYGTTQRNLVANPIADVNYGHVSLGDQLKVPATMYRPNVDYEFYVDHINDYYTDETAAAYNATLEGALSADVELTADQAYAYNAATPGAEKVEGNILTEEEAKNYNYKLSGAKHAGDEYLVDNAKLIEYHGLMLDAMGKDEALLGKHVYINIRYAFKGGLSTNAGNDFVKSVSENKWYTFEAMKRDGTPQLAQYTNAWGMEVKEGRGTHYTNDYLWTPVGDPYGFKMYHRYTYVNSGAWNDGEVNRVMTTTAFSEGQDVTMGSNDKVTAEADSYCIYELLEAKTDGYFKIHPVHNSAGTQYYFKIVRAHEDNNDAKPEHDYIRLTSDEVNYTEFTFGLSEDMVKPYYDRRGYVGGLNTDGVDAYEAATNLMEKQAVVYDTEHYIIPFEYGYYRLVSPADISGIVSRYASGYTHKIELTANGGNPIPLHFYERKGVNTTFEILGLNTSPATRGAIPIPEPAADPASIFRFEQVPWADAQGNPSGVYRNYQNIAILSTQGLYVKGERGPGATESASDRAKAIMTEPAGSTPTSSEATPLFVMDIGGGIMLIHDQQTADRRANLKYLSFDQNDSEDIYDLKLTHNTHTDHAKWLMESVNVQGLTLTAHSGFNAETYGETYYHTTFCAPFDVLISGDKGKAYTCVEGDSPWPITGSATEGELHPKPIGVYNRGTYAGNNKFVPAGTPVLIATTDNSGKVKLEIPTKAPSASITTIFSGKYLEQKLDVASPVRDVYVLGLPFVSTLERDADYASTGNISGKLPQQAETGIGFYINANQNKELGLAKGEWTRNNLYVLANKAYYRAPAPAPAPTRGVEFVPVIFGDDAEDNEFSTGVSGIKEDGNEEAGRSYDNRVYDLQGRCVATEEQVKDGTWRMNVKPGIYIFNGKKVFVRR